MSLNFTLVNNTNFTFLQYIVYHVTAQSEVLTNECALWGGALRNGGSSISGTVNPVSGARDYWVVYLVDNNGSMWYNAPKAGQLGTSNVTLTLAMASNGFISCTLTNATSGGQWCLGCIPVTGNSGSSIQILPATSNAAAGTKVSLFANANYAVNPANLRWTASGVTLEKSTGLKTAFTMPASGTVTVTVTDTLLGMNNNVSISVPSGGGVISITPSAPIVLQSSAQNPPQLLTLTSNVAANWSASPASAVNWGGIAGSSAPTNTTTATLTCAESGLITITASASDYEAGCASITSVPSNVVPSNVDLMAYGADGNTYIIKKSGDSTKLVGYPMSGIVQSLIESDKLYDSVENSSEKGIFVSCYVMNVQSFVGKTST